MEKKISLSPSGSITDRLIEITKYNVKSKFRYIDGIKQFLFLSGSITAATRVVLANALHFKSEWLEPFDKEDTKQDQTFNTPDGAVSVDMMTSDAVVNYEQRPSDGAVIAAIPFRGEGEYFVVVVPGEGQGESNDIQLTNATGVCAPKWQQIIQKNEPRFTKLRQL